MKTEKEFIIKNLTKYYINNKIKTLVFKNLNFLINKGELAAIIGPNGCGKTTLLNIIAGINNANSGEVLFSEQKNKANIGFIFQNYGNSLFPWLKVKDNISFPLSVNGVSLDKRNKKVKNLCKRFSFNVNTDLYPYQLSNGQQQLVAILRSLINEPNIILMDEPFCSLDYYTELSLLQKFICIWQKTKITTLLVSHNVDQAVFLAQKIIILSKKPTKILRIFRNPVPYPRNIKDFQSNKYAKLKKQILKYLLH